MTSQEQSPKGGEAETSESSDHPPTISDPVRAADSARYLAELASLELLAAEQRRKRTAADRNKALTELIRSRWGGPIVLGCMILAGIIILGGLAVAGADLTIVQGLADSAAHAWSGCPTKPQEAP
jgi:hypothetical protein